VDAGCLPRRESRTILGILILEDIIMAVILAVFSAMAGKVSLDYLPVTLALAKAIGFCLFFLIFERPIRGVINFILKVEPDEIFIIEIIGLIFMVSLIAKFIGLSEATGAFFIGSAMAESRHKHRIKTLLEPLGFFAAALFFLSFGLQIDLLAIDAQVIYIVSVLIAVSIVGKYLTGLASAPIERLSLAEAKNVGYSLFSRGEFSILIAALFVQKQAWHGIKEITAIYVFVLMILSTFLIKKYTISCQSDPKPVPKPIP
jgi:CPA2 family monovalent cation:H+ antiporter-2